MSENKIKRKVIKLLVLGDNNIGKTSIIYSYQGHNFSEQMLFTLGLDISKSCFTKDNNEIKIIIWDTGGAEK